MKKFLFLGVLAFLLASCSSDSQSESGFSQVHFVEPGTAIVAHKEFRLNQEGAYTFEVSTQNPPPNPIDPNVYGLTLSYKIHVNQLYSPCLETTIPRVSKQNRGH